jgi:DNA-binding NarL/FixJ family response regulator
MTRVYLVDDHPIVRAGLRATLEAAGHQVLGESDNATEALAEVLRLQPQVLLLDIQLGACSGLELLESLRHRGSKVPVVVLTMSERPRDLARALRAGALGYLLKGTPASELLACVSAVAQGKRHLGAGLADLAVMGLTAEAAQIDLLSPRERQVVALVTRGVTSAAIGEHLHLSPKTVDTYRSRIMAKLGLADLPALVRWAIRQGLVDLNES